MNLMASFQAVKYNKMEKSSLIAKFTEKIRQIQKERMVDWKNNSKTSQVQLKQEFKNQEESSCKLYKNQTPSSHNQQSPSSHNQQSPSSHNQQSQYKIPKLQNFHNHNKVNNIVTAQKLINNTEELDDLQKNDSHNIFPEIFKREFVQQIIQAVKNKGQRQRMAYLKDKSKQKNVDCFEAKVWVISYRIVFQIEKTNKQDNKHNLNEQIIRKVKEFAKKNPKQKKYMIIRIMKHIFQAFSIEEINYTQLYRQNIQPLFECYNLDNIQNENNDQKLIDGLLCQYQRAHVNQIEPKKGKQIKKRGRVKKMHDKINHKENQSLKSQAQFGQKQFSDKKERIQRKRLKKKQQKNVQQRPLQADIDRYLLLAEDDCNQTQPKYNLYNYNNDCKKQRKQNGALSKSKYPEQFKKRVANRLDRAFNQMYNNFIDHNADELCVQKPQIQNILLKYGYFFKKISADHRFQKQQDKKQENKPRRQLIKDSKTINLMIKQTQANGDNNQRIKLSNKNENIGKKFKIKVQNHSSYNPFGQLQNKMIAFLQQNMNPSPQQFHQQVILLINKINFKASIKKQALAKWIHSFIQQHSINFTNLQQSKINKPDTFHIQINQDSSPKITTNNNQNLVAINSFDRSKMQRQRLQFHKNPDLTSRNFQVAAVRQNQTKKINGY